MMVWVRIAGFSSADEPAPSLSRNNAGCSPGGGGAEDEHLAVLRSLTNVCLPRELYQIRFYPMRAIR